ncbi:hypothetical protein Kfla_0589 [Kribbella flavida DSM 17836]|uniref:DUF4190 domain-containing protein n=1 Tax=Kribbella flavida (strain DSM 17836 / JCM 10339 / NBRC 14399) TaxID=479435 RepID=D2PX62_KRIFD|nr:DUF4190 domain-containing protein [Kribbella flavida]ADB29710.1 hypothetical protein Kfla_0589 [Kribbella flavida DSM 17836]
MTQPPVPLEPARLLPSAESWLDGVPVPAQRRLDRFAVAALAFSLPGLVPVGLTLAAVALRRIRRNGSRGRPAALAALAISGCWVIAIAVAAALGLYGERQAGIGRSVAIAEVRVAQCFDADLAAETLRVVRLADCAAAHSGEAYAKVRAAMTGLSTQQKGASATQHCATAFREFVGTSYEQSALDMYYVVLEDQAVADGNVLCMVGGERLTGTMRGSQR